MRMKALASHDFDQIRRNPGDIYEAADPNMINIVEKLGWAKKVVEPQEIATVIAQRQQENESHAPPHGNADEIAAAAAAAADMSTTTTGTNRSRSRRSYGRRDMTAES